MVLHALLAAVGVVLTPSVLSLPVSFKFGQTFVPDLISPDIFHAGPSRAAQPPPPPAQVLELPGYGALPDRSYAGYLPVNATCGSYLYFWLVESQNDPHNDPVVIWLNGGPGSSSFLGAMIENGPFLLKDGTVHRNPYAWNRNATYVMIDQPAGVGFSFVEDRACYAPDERSAMDHLYTGVKQMMRHLPQYAKLPLYVFGESYAGKYVPELAVRLLQDSSVDLAGIGLGDAWVDPKSLQMTYAEYAYAHGLLSAGAGRAGAEKLQQACLAMYINVEHNDTATPDDWRRLDRTCNRIEAFIVNQTGGTTPPGGVNVYDVRSFTAQYDFAPLAQYLNKAGVRSALHVDSRVSKWRDSDDTVAYILEAQEQKSSMHLMPYILQKTRVLVYNGIFDMDCNFLSTDAWLSALEWSGADAYRAAQRTPWSSNGKMLGHALQVQNLTQVLVLGAGHLVPMDQGKAALDMLNTFLGGLPFVATSIAAQANHQVVV